MCSRGNWSGFTYAEIGPDNVPVVIEQCSRCGDYRGVTMDEMPIISQ